VTSTQAWVCPTCDAVEVAVNHPKDAGLLCSACGNEILVPGAGYAIAKLAASSSQAGAAIAGPTAQGGGQRKRRGRGARRDGGDTGAT
jgi:ribosomal protein S27E